MYKQVKGFHVGNYKHGIHFGIVIDKYGFDISLIKIFIGWER
jgi:hypothetical protein